MAADPTVQTLAQTKRFAQKAARSITELQDHVNNVADVVVFLEVLGYTENLVKQYGFKSVYKLARYICEFIDILDAEESSGGSLESLSSTIPSKFRRVTESPGILFPLLGSLALLSVVGVSPWMSMVMPLQVFTPLIGGALLGLALSEGCLHAFGRLFSFYLGQDNLGETKRVLRRCYYFSFTVVGLGAVLVLFATLALAVPHPLIAVLLGSYLTVATHRVSHMTMYALRLFAEISLAYITAFVVVMSVYLLSGDLVPDVTTRLLSGLGAAFIVLIVPALYNNYNLLRMKTVFKAPEEALRLSSLARIGDKTLVSRLGVQIWETLPNFLFGIFSFSMLFLDRVISWVFNPYANANQMILFNSIYGAGADTALVLLLPTFIVAYAMTAPMYAEVRNSIFQLSASEMEILNRLLRERYKKVLSTSILTSVLGMLILVALSDQIMTHLTGSNVSAWIFSVATVANVFMAVFVANGMFLSALRRVKILAITSVLCTLIVGAGGYLLAQSGFQNIVLAYLLSSITAMIISTIYVSRIVTRAASIFLAKYL